MGEHLQAVTGEQKLASHTLGRDRIVNRDIPNKPSNISQRPRPSNDRHLQCGMGG